MAARVIQFKPPGHQGHNPQRAARKRFHLDVGTHTNLIKLIDKFANDKQKLLSFWNKDPAIFSMDAHIDELLENYGAR